MFGLVNQAILVKQVKAKIEAYEKKFLVKFLDGYGSILNHFNCYRIGTHTL